MASEAPLLWAGNIADFIEGVDGSPYDDGSGGPVVIDPYLSVEDDGLLVSATVAITGNFNASQDVLAFVNDNAALYGDISVVSYSGGVLSLVSASGTASIAQWEAALHSVTYENLSHAPDPGQRTIVFTVSDGESQSDPVQGTSLVNIIANNDAPSGTNLTIGVSQNGAHVLTLADFGFVDPDGHNFSSVILYGPVTGTGQLYYDPWGTLIEATPFNLGAWEVSVEDIIAGKILYRAAPNSTGIAGTLSFAVRDDGGLWGTGIGWDTAETLNTMTFQVTTNNHAPDLTAPTSADVYFEEQMFPTKLMQGVEVSDADGVLSFPGGSLTISISGSGGSIEFAPAPYPGAGTEFTVSGSDIIFNESGLVVGTVSGYGTTSVTVTPNSNAHAFIIEELAQGFIFYDDSLTPNTADRTVTLTFNDGGLNGTGTPLSDTVTQILHTTANGPVADLYIVGESAVDVTNSLLANDINDSGIRRVNGLVENVGNTFVLSSGASLTVHSNGYFTYDPNGLFDHLAQWGLGASNDSATDSFTYTDWDGETTTVTLQIRGAYSVPHNMEGTSGNDTITGTAFADIILGGLGADTMSGSGGNDLYAVDQAGDKVVELGGQGTDTVQSSMENYILGANVENLVLLGAVVKGTGNGLNNVITGNGGSNYINGAGGADTMYGGAGTDIYYVDHAGDQVIETDAADGVDTVRSSVNFVLGTFVEHLTLLKTAVSATGNGLDNVINGNTIANTLTGGGGNDVLKGAGGGDTMIGGTGNDSYYVDNASDVVTEAAGEGTQDWVFSDVAFTLTAEVENLTLLGTGSNSGTGNGLNNRLTGNGGDNLLRGEGGADVMFGGAGLDRLIGGAGKDTMTGGGGADRFYFDTALNAVTNVDKINDFSSVDDTIFLNRSVFTGIASNGTLAAGAFVNGTAAADATDRILYDSATGNIFYDADGTGAAAAVLFATVNVGTVLNNTDFTGY